MKHLILAIALVLTACGDDAEEQRAAVSSATVTTQPEEAEFTCSGPYAENEPERIPTEKCEER